jgi:hypothetical protein
MILPPLVFPVQSMILCEENNTNLGLVHNTFYSRYSSKYGSACILASLALVRSVITKLVQRGTRSSHALASLLAFQTNLWDTLVA